MKLDLGYTEKMPMSPCEAGNATTASSDKCEEKTTYPTLYFRSKDKLSLPDGRFMFMAEGRVTSRTERSGDEDDPEDGDNCSYEIEIYSMDAKGASPVDDSLKVSIGSMLKDKMRKSMKKGEYADDGEE